MPPAHLLEFPSVNLKKLIIGLASGVFFTACGGPLPEEGMEAAVEVEEVGDVEQGYCEGWDDGARKCTWRCTANGPWIWATSPVAYGGCRAYADDFCRGNAYAVCWSKL